MSVEAILKTKGQTVYSVRPEHSVADAAQLMKAKKVGVALVCDARDRIVGTVSERDVVNGLAEFGKGVVDMPVRNIMSSPVITCKPTDSVKHIMEVMTEQRVRHLPVVDKGRMLGIVSIGDAVHARLQEQQIEMGVLRDFAVVR